MKVFASSSSVENEPLFICWTLNLLYSLRSEW